jgi:predicted peptidase
MTAFYRDEHQRRQPCFVLRPVAIQGRNWVSPRGAGTGSHKLPAAPAASVTVLLELLDRTLKHHPIDPDSLHVVRASMGGYGVWDLISRQPKRFASAIPICGGADPSPPAGETAAGSRAGRTTAGEGTDTRRAVRPRGAARASAN